MYSTWYLSVLYFPTPLPTSLTSSPLLASPCSAQQLGSHDHIWIFLAKLDARPISQKHPGNSATRPRILQVSSFASVGRCLDASKCAQLAGQNDRRIAPHHRSHGKTCTLGDCDGERYACHWPQTGGIHPPLAEMMKQKVDAWSWKPSSNVDYIHIDYRFHQKWTLFGPCSTSLPDADPLLAEALVGEAVIPL